MGKYGPQVQALLKKAAALDIATICPLHGPVLTGDLGKYLAYYDTWSSYKPEEPEKILVASASIHGHTRAAAHTMAEKLRAKGAKVVEMDLTRTDVSYVCENVVTIRSAANAAAEAQMDALADEIVAK